MTPALVELTEIYEVVFSPPLSTDVLYAAPGIDRNRSIFPPFPSFQALPLFFADPQEGYHFSRLLNSPDPFLDFFLFRGLC